MRLCGTRVGRTLIAAQNIIGQCFAPTAGAPLNGSNSLLGGSECCVNGQSVTRRNYNGRMLLEGVFAAVTTCFYPDGRPYWRKLEHNMDRYSLTAMSGMVLLGSTGEAVMLSDEESREVLRVARGATAADKVLVAGVGRESVIETLRLADYAAEQAYDVVLVRTPHFYRKQMREREMLTYYQAVADRSPLPVLLYSVPGCTAYDLPIGVVAELAMHPNIIGMKDSSGNVERIGELVMYTELMRACMRAAEADAEIDECGVMCPASLPAETTRNLFMTAYPKMVEILQLLGSSSLMALPTEADMGGPLGGHIDQYLATDGSSARERVKLFHLAWDIACSSFGSRQVLYERFFASDPLTRARALASIFPKQAVKDRVLDFLARELGVCEGVGFQDFNTEVSGEPRGTRSSAARRL